MADWIKIEDQTPEEGATVITFFEHTGIEVAKYHDLEGTEDEMFGKNFFCNKKGFLTDDVTHWMPYEEGQELPTEPPEGWKIIEWPPKD